MWKNIAIATTVVAVLIGSAAAVVTLDNAPAAEQTQQQLGQAGLGGQGGQGQGKGDQGNPGGGQGGGNAGDRDQTGKAGQGQQGKDGGGGQGGSRSAKGEGTSVSAEDWVTVEGTITQVDTNAIVIQTVEGDTLTVEVGPPHFVEGLGVEFQSGDEISVLGFYDDDEFEAGQITFLATGEEIVLRDEDGHPLWAGAGGGGAGGSADGGKGGQGGSRSAKGEGTSVSAEDWVTVEGTITQVDDNVLVIQTAEDDALTVKVGPPHFVEGLGVEFQSGDEISVLGFYEDGEFEAAQITFLATGEEIVLRDEDGHPLWAGGGGGAGGSADGGKGGQGGYKGGR